MKPEEIEVMEEIMLSGEDLKRLDRLKKKLGGCDSEVVSAALLLYENALNAVDEGSQKWMTLEFVVGEEEDR